jgi:hypothetical protein
MPRAMSQIYWSVSLPQLRRANRTSTSDEDALVNYSQRNVCCITELSALYVTCRRSKVYIFCKTAINGIYRVHAPVSLGPQGNSKDQTIFAIDGK